MQCIGGVLLNSFAVSNIAFENREIRDRIILEHIPSAQRHLDPILQALREERIIRITYNAFDRDEAHTVEVKPYFVKCYERRWYLFAPS
ncbi:MAG: WYL domain-containing protein, partial [Alistipes sp.]|nr:WYL domain-containing protein [Alistipes sp.]